MGENDNSEYPDHHTVRLSGNTLMRLDQRKAKKQSWDGVVSETLDENEELREENQELQEEIERLRAQIDGPEGDGQD